MRFFELFGFFLAVLLGAPLLAKALPKLLSDRKRLAQPSLMICWARAMVSASAGTFLVTTVG